MEVIAAINLYNAQCVNSVHDNYNVIEIPILLILP